MSALGGYLTLYLLSLLFPRCLKTKHCFCISVKAFGILILEAVPTLPERKERVEDTHLQLKTNKQNPHLHKRAPTIS